MTIKRGVLLLFLLLIISNVVSGYTISSLDLTYTEADLVPGVLFSTPLSSSVNIVLELDSEDVISVSFYCSGGSCSNGDLIGSGLVINNRVGFSFDSSLFSSNFFVFYTDLDSSNYRFRMQSTGVSTQTCVGGCTDSGIVEYFYSEISSSESCDDHIFSLTDYSFCPSVNQDNCSDFGAYNPIDMSSCSANYKKYALLTPCGDVSTENFVYKVGTVYSDVYESNCTLNNYYSCEGKNLYSITKTGNFDDDICACEVKKTLKETCLSDNLCNSGEGICEKPTTSTTGAAIINTPDMITVDQEAKLVSNIEVTWEVLDSNNKAIVFNQKAKELTLTDLEVGRYRITADNQINYLDVVTCMSDNDCSNQICVNPSTLNSSCQTKVCSNDEDCYKIITKEFPLAYDIKCMNSYSVDSYCDYKNITCKSEQDCVGKVPIDAKGVVCLNPGKKDSSCQYANCNMECSFDSECDDNDEATIDVCQLPGTCQSVCLNKLQFIPKEPERINYDDLPYLDFMLYNQEQCKFKLNGKYETITRLPIQLRNSIEGNNSLSIECESFVYNTWYNYKVQKDEPTKVEETIAELKQVLSKEKIKQIDGAQDKLKDIITVQNTIEEINGTSQITTSLDIKENVTDLEVYLQIPKCMAESVRELEFDNEEFQILIDDPLIMWHFKEALSQQDLIYRVKKQVSKECFDQLKVMTSADFEVDNSWWVYIVLIPIIFFVYSYFSKFAIPPTDEEKDSDAVENYVKLLRKRVEKLREEFSEDHIKTLLEEEGIDDHLIEKAMSL
ncbi:hypothetical protein JXM83_00290 [Candidatus Woesearchaeota archaeon]|nr:hypothetical protein [Candidatus Woesearchaeota archaeon]